MLTGARKCRILHCIRLKAIAFSQSHERSLRGYESTVGETTLRTRLLVIAMVLIIGVICLSIFLVLGPSLPPAPTPDLNALVQANKLPCILFYDASQLGSFP